MDFTYPYFAFGKHPLAADGLVPSLKQCPTALKTGCNILGVTAQDRHKHFDICRYSLTKKPPLQLKRGYIRI